MIKIRTRSIALIGIGLLALLPPVIFGQSKSSPEREEVLTNESIIKMVNAGLKTETIIRKIEASRSDFDLSTDGLIALKKANVPDDVITAMLEKRSEALGGGPSAASVQPRPMAPPRRSWRHHCGCCWW